MVVRSEKARLHEHSVGNAIRVQYLDVVFGSCVIIGRITADICKREAALEDVRMAVNSGHYPERLTRDGAIRQYAHWDEASSCLLSSRRLSISSPSL